MTGDTSVLDRLTPSERDILVLLAQGHTAKSIATLRDLSVAAVNERLRSARRKTGVGSSRELARLVSAQQDRDDLIGLAAEPADAHPSPRPDAASSRPVSPFRRWKLPMTAAVVLAATALLAQQTAVPAVASQQNAGLAAAILTRQSEAPDARTFHAQLQSEQRDAAWADATEARLSALYNAVPDLSRHARDFSVRCAATLCEVAGVLKPEVETQAAVDLITKLQELDDQGPAAGVTQVMYQGAFGEGRPAFVMYWRRD